MPDLDTAGATIPLPTQVRGRTIFGYNPGASQLVPVQVDAAGAVVTVGGAGVPTTLGPTPVDTALLPLAVSVPLPVGPLGTDQQIVQNTGPAGSLIRVRELGGIAGTGIILPRFAIFVFDAGFPLEVDEIAGLPGSVMVTWES